MQPRSNIQTIYDTLDELSTYDYINYITLMKDTIVSSVPPQKLSSAIFDLYSYFRNLGGNYPAKESLCRKLIILFAPELGAAPDFDVLNKFLEIEKDSDTRSDIAHAMVSSINSLQDLLSIVKKLNNDKRYSLLETHKKYFDQLRQVNTNNIGTASSLNTVSTSSFATFQSDVQLPVATGNESAPENTKTPTLN